MPNDTQLTYRTPHEDTAAPFTGPREDLGRAELPVVGEVTGEVRLDRSFHVSVDRRVATLRPAGGLVLRSEPLPTIAVRSVNVDLVDGLVRTDADGLGAFFDRVATVVLCSVLRQALGWQPGTSMTEPLAERLPRGRRRFPRTSVAVGKETRLELDVAGDAITLSLSRPAILRFLGLPMKLTGLRYDFATATVTSETSGVGPIRRGLVKLLAWGATRWLRPRLPAAMRRAGYDLFADTRRRENLLALVGRLRGEPDKPETMGAGAGRPGHELARAGEGDKAGMLGVLSGSKAAIVAALLAVRITTDDAPAATRVIMNIPLGPLSRLALCTDRGGEVVLVKYPGGVRIEAPLGIYLFADQFPELAELRLTRVDVDLSHKDDADLDIQTVPPLGPVARALLHHVVDTKIRPKLPKEQMNAAGVWDESSDHVLWRHDLGDDRRFTVRTRGDAEVRVRHTEEGLVIEAPAGLEAVFDGVPVPAAKLERIMYRWDDGMIETEGGSELGAFGHTVAGSLMRVRAAPHLPAALGAKVEDQPGLDPAQLEKFPAVIAAIKLPVIGALELRMDPNDTLSASLGLAAMNVHSERGLLFVAPELRLALHIRAVDYDVATKALNIDASPAPGPYMTTLGVMTLEALLLPLLRKAFPSVGDGDAASKRWMLYEGSGVHVSLPPGASLTARRTPDKLELGGSEPIEVDGQGGIVADFTINKLHWIAADDRIVVDSTPSAGPLMAGLVRRVIDQIVPDFVARGVAERLALTVPKEREKSKAPTMPPLFETEVASVGKIGLYLDARTGMTLTVRREQAELRLGAGAYVRAERFDAQVVVRRVVMTFLPFTLAIDSEPGTGELEDHLLAQVARTLVAPVMRMFWPADRQPQAGRDVLLALGADAAWGPIELCVPPGGQVEVGLDHEGVTLRSEAGVFVAGVDWLPNVGVHAMRVRFEDGAVDLEVGEVAERFYHEAAPVSATSTMIAARMLRTLVSPHVPGWAQRLGMRVLPPPPPLMREPTRKIVWESQLPGGLAKIKVGMDPMDLLEIRASRVELSFTSELGLHLDLENLGLRLTVFHARYHMLSGELQLGDMGQFENAIVEGLVRKALATVDPTAAPADEISLIDVLERFPINDKGERILFGDKVVQILMDPASVIVLRVGTEGLAMTVDPPLKIDGPAVLNFVFGGLRYDFVEGEFKLDLKHDGVVSRLLSGLFKKEGEGVLNSLRPALPAAMRKPGYSLANDPNPSVTLAGLVRTVTRGRPATPGEVSAEQKAEVV